MKIQITFLQMIVLSVFLNVFIILYILCLLYSYSEEIVDVYKYNNFMNIKI